MRGLYACLFLLFAVSTQSIAQEVDTIPINIRNMDLQLKKSPLPVLSSPLIFKPVVINPVVISSKINYWKTKTSIGLNVNQASFSNNWTGGGVNSLAVGGLVNYRADYVKDNYSYSSEVALQYGKVKNKDQLQKKTTDRIFWDNKAAFQLSKNWYFYGSLTFESQFDNGFSYSTDENGVETATIISKFMSPGYLTESVGFEYKPVKYFSTRIGTGTARQTFVLANDELTAAANDPSRTDNYGVPVGDTFKNDIAFQVTANLDKDIMPNVNLKTRYNIFVPYNKIGYTSHRLDVAVTAKVNRLINVSITGVGLYDRNTAAKIQGSQTLAMGFAFVFPR
ncbi:MAG TPA: DUF3078 domain-containing protein [Pedobacter sp.]